MFGYVSVYQKELTQAQRGRYGAVYCGICRRIREQASQLSSLCLSYDMAFLALLLMSLYEPEETSHPNACLLHPIKKRPWVDNVYIRYAADMNVALAYYNCLDDWQDEGKLSAKLLGGELGRHMARIESAYPCQCAAIRNCIEELSHLEEAGCQNPDEPAACFGNLMAELFVVWEDHWSPCLRRLGMALGRFIYLLDAAVDYRRDERKKQYNPWLAMGMEENWPKWEEYLTMEMGRCTREYEMLPLVQDKDLLDNILYSGVWVNYRAKRKEENR